MVYKTVNKNKNLKYPVFMECSELCNDEEWKQLYNDLAYGKYNQNIYISNTCIKLVTKNKNDTSYDFSNKKAEDIVVDLHEFILKYTNFCSAKDLKKKKHDIAEIQKTHYQYKNWKDIKIKHIKAQYIDKFVLEMKKKYKLSSAATLDLSSLINTGLLFQSIVSNDIEFKDGEIKNINGIVYKNGKFINTHKIKLSKEQPDINTDNCIYYQWPKFMSNVNTQIQEFKK